MTMIARTAEPRLEDEAEAEAPTIAVVVPLPVRPATDAATGPADTAAAEGRPTAAEAYGLDEGQLADLARELDALRAEVVADLGQRDLDHIRGVIRLQRGLEATGRASLFLGLLPPFWLAGTSALALAKILDNMEIGHNVMHGQYDWTRDPALSSAEFEWDTVCPSSQWRHSHNVVHHTFTNIVGKDRDVGYGVLRMSEDQKWRPHHLGNPLYAALLAVMFEWGVMLHDLEVEKLVAGKKSSAEAGTQLAEMGHKAGRQALKDYVLFPALTGPGALATLTANATANVTRNLWAFTIIFCGHFPDGVAQFTEAESEDESRGHWYLRQLLGSANLNGNRLFHLMTGNLSFQIEHHLFPDLPANRYHEIAPRVREVCERYGLPYNTGGLARQFGSVARRITRFALPGSRP
jgi:NADPH-dependent stearoyl-CoA 9-desaturase